MFIQILWTSSTSQFSHSNNQTNKISINHKLMCSLETEGESEEEIKPAAEQIECWWPSFMQPNLSRRQQPPQATEGWLSLFMATIHSSTSQRGLHHWWLPISLSFCFILWLIWWLGYESLRISFRFGKWGLVDSWVLICALLKLLMCFRMGF